MIKEFADGKTTDETQSINYWFNNRVTTLEFNKLLVDLKLTVREQAETQERQKNIDDIYIQFNNSDLAKKLTTKIKTALQNFIGFERSVLPFLFKYLPPQKLKEYKHGTLGPGGLYDYLKILSYLREDKKNPGFIYQAPPDQDAEEITELTNEASSWTVATIETNLANYIVRRGHAIYDLTETAKGRQREKAEKTKNGS